MRWNRRNLVVSGAAVFALIGVGAGLRTLLPAWPGRSSTEAPQPRQVNLPLFSLPIAPEFETEVTAESAPDVAREMASLAMAAGRKSPDLSALGVRALDALHVAVEEQAAIYLSGDFDRHWAFLQRTGAGYPIVDRAGSDADARRKVLDDLRQFWNECSAGFALHPVSLEEATIRVRYNRGREVPCLDDIHAKQFTTAPDRWPLLSGEPAPNKYTIVEFLYPVFFNRGSNAGPVYHGVWLVWDEPAGDWKIHQLRVYNPAKVRGVSIVPVF